MLHWYAPHSWHRVHRACLWFFPVASAYAAVIMPLTLYSFLYNDGLPGLADRTGHAYEMFFGLGLALVSGYLLGKQPMHRLVLMLVFWALSRVTHLWLPFSWWSLGCEAVFVALVMLRLVPKLNVAKRWRNRSLVPMMILLGAAPVVTILIAQWSTVWAQHDRMAYASLLLFALLMTYMGGRAIAPAAAGAHLAEGRELQPRVQPRLEGALIIILGGTSLLVPWVDPVWTGPTIALAGVLILVRLARWRIDQVAARTDLLCMSVGYAWLGLGLMALGSARMLGWPTTAVLHLITVGALGTLSTGVMSRVVLRYTVGAPPPPIGLVLITACLAVATVTRCAADFSELLSRDNWLRLSVIAWSTAYAGLTVWLFMAVLFKAQRADRGLRL